jgi:hypothetical protein
LISAEDTKDVSFEDLEGVMYYRFDLNADDKIGNYVSGVDIPANETFTNATEQDRAGTPTCQQTFPDKFLKCFDCAMSECFSNWLCGLACSIKIQIALGCAAAAATHCMGIGPNTTH